MKKIKCATGPCSFTEHEGQSGVELSCKLHALVASGCHPLPKLTIDVITWIALAKARYASFKDISELQSA
jgi:hypothetical protein